MLQFAVSWSTTLTCCCSLCRACPLWCTALPTHSLAARALQGLALRAWLLSGAYPDAAFDHALLKSNIEMVRLIPGLHARHSLVLGLLATQFCLPTQLLALDLPKTFQKPCVSCCVQCYGISHISLDPQRSAAPRHDYSSLTPLAHAVLRHPPHKPGLQDMPRQPAAAHQHARARQVPGKSSTHAGMVQRQALSIMHSTPSMYAPGKFQASPVCWGQDSPQPIRAQVSACRHGGGACAICCWPIM